MNYRTVIRNSRVPLAGILLIAALAARSGMKTGEQKWDVQSNKIKGVVPSGTDFEAQATPATDHSALSVLFDGKLKAELKPGSPSHITATHIFSVPFTPTSNKKLRGFRADLRGAAIKSADSRLVLIVDFGTRTQLIEFPFGRVVGMGRTQNSSEFTRTYFAPVATSEEKGKVDYTVVFSLIAQRRTVKGMPSKDQALLTVDSLDVVPVYY